MKKLDKLIFRSFIGPFFLTFCVVVFIFLLQFLLQHFDDIVGKGLSWDIYARLLGFFSINMTPVSFPLAVLLSALMTYGNLGEHSEITALKSAGISLTRTLIPMFVFSIILTVAAYLSNNYLVPKANLKAYSLLYDIRQKAPALNIKEGVFYKEIPGYQIKVNKKFRDGKSLKDVIIYSHNSKTSGNREVTMADSGRMYTIYNDRYLVMELFNGHHYIEMENQVKGGRGRYPRNNYPEPYYRNTFDHCKFVFSMASFDLKRTKEELFASHRLMKNTNELRHDIDSMQNDIRFAKYEVFVNLKTKYNYHLDQLGIPDNLKPKNYGRKAGVDSAMLAYEQRLAANSPKTSFSNNVEKMDTAADTTSADRNESVNQILSRKKESRPALKESSGPQRALLTENRPGIGQKITDRNFVEKRIYKGPPISKIGADSVLNGKFDTKRILTSAITSARFVKNHIMVTSSKVNVKNSELIKFKIQRYKIFAQAFSCLIMFLIGAPLGSIIKRGGLGFPVIVSIGFFIVYYVFMSMGQKWANEHLITPFFGVWLANIVMAPFGLVLLIQARRDAKLFDSDFYNVIIQKLGMKIPDKLKKPRKFILLNR